MKKGIVVISFGTTYKKTRELCIESIEDRIRNEYKDSLVLRAFTSRMIINKLKKRDNYLVDNPTEALEKMKEKEVKDICIQPLLIIEGVEYEKLLAEVRDFSKKNKDYNITVGKPLLSYEDDYNKVVEALNLSQEEAVVFMGHGSEHRADISYKRLEDIIRDKGYKDVFIGTVEGERTITDLILELKERKIDKVILKPFMLVAGDHATKDMASDDADSWKSILEKNEIDVDVEVKGLGETKEIQDIFINHLEKIIEF